MCHHLYLFLLLFLCVSPLGAQAPVATINGKTFHLGDSLTVGLPNTPGESFRALAWSRTTSLQLPPFTKAKLKRYVRTPSKDFFADLIGGPDTLYYLSHPQFPKDTIFIALADAVQYGEIITAPTEDHPLYPEAVELRPADYIPALIKAGYLSYSDEALKAYIHSAVDSERANAVIGSPFEYQRQRTQLQEELKKAVERFDLSRLYYVRHEFAVKGYDFTRSGYSRDYLLGTPLPTLQTPGESPVILYLSTQRSVPFVSVPAERAEAYEKRSGTIGMDYHALHMKAYIRLLPVQSYAEDGTHVYNMQVDYLGADVYEHPHCAYYYLGSAKAE